MANKWAKEERYDIVFVTRKDLVFITYNQISLWHDIFAFMLLA